MLNNPCIDHGKAKPRYAHTTWNGKCVGLHRKEYCLAHGCTPDEIAGKVVRHLCDNPRCINPEHLELGTHSDNMQDMVERQRSAVGEQQGRSTVGDADAQTIHDRYIKGDVSMGALAKEYGVSKFAIQYIIKHRKSVCRN